MLQNQIWKICNRIGAWQPRSCQQGRNDVGDSKLIGAKKQSIAYSNRQHNLPAIESRVSYGAKGTSSIGTEARQLYR